MSQMPEIKPVVNKEPERDKKKGGLLARLFGGGGSGGGAGLGGGFGAAGGGGMSGLAGGGIVATKAGLLALILVGTTVAGGIGLVGYQMFGPGAAMTGNGDNLQLFASKPKESASADGQNGGAKGDGSSASLQYLSQANTSPAQPDAAAAGAAKDATAGSATGADSSASAGGGANGAINAAGGSGNGVSHAMLHNTAKFGTLSGPTGGGGSGAVASAAPQKAAPFDANAATKGSLSRSRQAAASVGGGTSRSVAGRHFNGAVGQGFAVLGNQKGAQSSYAAGQTYDGAAQGGSNIGANGTPIGGPGAAAGGGSAQPKSVPGPATDQNSSTNIPTPPATPMAPWQSQIQKAQMLIGIATAILLACSLINKAKTPWTMTLVKILGGIVAAIGALVVVIGAAIAHGKYGQTLQGGVLGAAGAGLILAGAMVAFSDTTDTNKAGNTVNTADNGTTSVTDAKGAAVPANAANGAGSTEITSSSNNALGSGGITDANPFVLIGGGLGLLGLAGTMMMPPNKYPAQDANDPAWPKGGLFGYHQIQKQMPSETALKKMVA